MRTQSGEDGEQTGMKSTATHLDGSLEELDGDIVLPLQAETISCYTPGLHTNAHTLTVIWKNTQAVNRCASHLRAVLVHVRKVFGEGGKGHIFLQVPQRGGINFHPFDPV